MRHYGAFEAKTHFSELLAEVVKGEEFVITKRGVEVAMLVPFTHKTEKVEPVTDAIRAIKKLRKEITLGKGLSIKKMMSEGRK